MLNTKGVLIILGVATVFFGIFYVFISLAMGQPVYSNPLVFGALIVSVALGMSVALVYLYKGNKIGE